MAGDVVVAFALPAENKSSSLEAALHRRRKQSLPRRATKSDKRATYFVLGLGTPNTGSRVLVHSSRNTMATTMPVTTSTTSIPSTSDSNSSVDSSPPASQEVPDMDATKLSSNLLSVSVPSKGLGIARAKSPGFDSDGVDNLTNKELECCANLKLSHQQYLKMKRTMLETARSSKLEKRQATRLFRNDAQKAGKLYDFFVESKLIASDGSLYIR